MQDRTELNSNSEQEELFEGYGGSQCTRSDILNAANAMNNLDEKYGAGANVINGFRSDIKWECAPENIKGPSNKATEKDIQPGAKNLFEMGVQFYNGKNYPKALENFIAATKIDSSYYQAFYYRGCCYGALGKHTQAVKEFTQAININKDYFWSYKQRGYSYLSLKKYHDALTDLNSVISLAPDHSPSYYFRALVHYNLQVFKNAREDINIAKKSNPNNQQYIVTEKKITNGLTAKENFNVGVRYYNSGQYEAAHFHFERATTLYPPGYYQAWHYRGCCCAALGKHSQAIADFKKAIEINPSYHWAHKELKITHEKIQKDNSSNDNKNASPNSDNDSTRITDYRGNFWDSSRNDRSDDKGHISEIQLANGDTYRW